MEKPPLGLLFCSGVRFMCGAGGVRNAEFNPRLRVISALSIYISAVPYFDHDDDQFVVFDLIEDAVIALSNTVFFQAR